MSNRAKAKGTSFESAVVTWLRDRGLDARRIVLHGSKDEGDIDTGAAWNLEAKNVRSMALGQWVEEAKVEAANAGRPVAVVHKRIGKGDPGQSFVTMTLEQFAEAVLGVTIGLRGARCFHELWNIRPDGTTFCRKCGVDTTNMEAMGT